MLNFDALTPTQQAAVDRIYGCDATILIARVKAVDIVAIKLLDKTV